MVELPGWNDYKVLEEENERLRKALEVGADLLDDVQNGNKWWTDIAEFVEEHKNAND